MPALLSQELILPLGLIALLNLAIGARWGRVVREFLGSSREALCVEWKWPR